MGTNSVVHSMANPKRILIRQKRIVAPDYPFYVVSMSRCTCGCHGYYVTLEKVDIGYVRKIFDIDFNTPLESFLKFEKLVEECSEGKYDMMPKKESEAFE